jgi:hypothetical protein
MKPTIQTFDAVTVHTFRHPANAWQLSIATNATPRSGKLSLGGFRIVPKALAAEPGFDPVKMAAGLAHGMEEKVYWSRILHVGGPLAVRDMGRIVGGKCVLVPTDDARVGQPRDRQVLDWAIDCLRRFDEETGIHVVTGQDLGHGIMSDGRTGSLDYMARRFRGCVDADTSKPTGEGNFHLLRGMLAGHDIDLAASTVGLVGIGNIGMHLLERLLASGATVLAVETSPARRGAAEKLGVRTFGSEDKTQFLAEPMDAIAVNANKESLDPASVDAIVRNPRLRVVCGSENLAMPDPSSAETLRVARRSYAPTELGGMMGYLTAVEEYLSLLESKPFDVETLMVASQRLAEAGERAARRQVERDFAISFEDAVREVYAGGPGGA